MPEVSSVDTESTPPRYCIGIDLGTTNCVLSYVDTDGESESRSVETFEVPQWVDLAVVEARSHLPSFHYTLTPAETEAASSRPGTSDLPSFLSEHRNQRVGEFARRAGLVHPGRQIASAKSWLSHEGVDRTADLLPWHGEEDVPRQSPHAVSAAYLAHLRAAWDDSHPDAPMAAQDVVITLPASFDEVARELTVKAAALAGLPRIQLIEEPQAAFYAWIHRQGDDWSSQVRAGQLILVCDIGGGTTDLTLIRVRRSGTSNESAASSDDKTLASDDKLQFHRIAVGKHLILGGDNLDLALAKHAETKLGDAPLSPEKWQRLVVAVRDVKDTMLGDDPPKESTIHLSGSGASLIGGATDVSVSEAEIEQVLLDGFFPQVELDEAPKTGQSGFQEIGLPYAADPAVTRHLAEFVSQHRLTGLDNEQLDSDQVDLVLFNGGVLRSPAIRERIVACLQRWFGSVQALVAPRLDLAVAQGAAYYALVRRGEGVRIAANLARTYLMQISTQPPRAVCVVPADAQGGDTFRIDTLPMQLQTGTPVSFPLWVSSTRLADRPGDVVDIDSATMTSLPPIQTALRDRKQREQQRLDIHIESELSEIGTIALYCVGAGKRWKLDFDIRGTLETDRQSHSGGGEAVGIVDEETMQLARATIDALFVENAFKPAKLIWRLQDAIGIKKEQWPPVLLREIWRCLLARADEARRNAALQARWLNLLGYALRPGYGVAVDDWRVSETWRSVHGKIAHGDVQTRSQAYVLWRRIAGGMTPGHQEQLASGLRNTLLSGNSTTSDAGDLSEAWRLIGSLERISPVTKLAFAEAACQLLGRPKVSGLHPALWWSLGRLASRQPIYGPINLVVPAEAVSGLLRKLQSVRQSKAMTQEVAAVASLALTQLGRRCGDRFRDLGEKDRQWLLDWLEDLDAAPHFLTLLREGGALSREEQSAVFGDSLPLGIQLRS